MLDVDASNLKLEWAREDFAVPQMQKSRRSMGSEVRLLLLNLVTKITISRRADLKACTQAIITVIYHIRRSLAAPLLEIRKGKGKYSQFDNPAMAILECRSECHLNHVASVFYSVL